MREFIVTVTGDFVVEAENEDEANAP